MLYNFNQLKLISNKQKIIDKLLKIDLEMVSIFDKELKKVLGPNAFANARYADKSLLFEFKESAEFEMSNSSSTYLTMGTIDGSADNTGVFGFMKGSKFSITRDKEMPLINAYYDVVKKLCDVFKNMYKVPEVKVFYEDWCTAWLFKFRNHDELLNWLKRFI